MNEGNSFVRYKETETFTFYKQMSHSNTHACMHEWNVFLSVIRFGLEYIYIYVIFSRSQIHQEQDVCKDSGRMKDCERSTGQLQILWTNLICFFSQYGTTKSYLSLFLDALASLRSKLRVTDWLTNQTQISKITTESISDNEIGLCQYQC